MSNSLLRRSLAKLMGNFNAYGLLPPYDYVQNVVEYHLSDYLGVPRTAILNIYIVGGYLGREIPRLLRSNPNCHITVFEPSERYINRLMRRFQNHPRVAVESCAVGDREGELEFFETNLKGSGSLLPVGSLAAQSFQAKAAETFTVRCITLDSHSRGLAIDCLWMDVQGAELLVLGGAKQSLQNIRSIFVEVSVHPELYKGSATLAEIDAFLRSHGFQVALLGLDKGNLTGNALYVRLTPNRELQMTSTSPTPAAV